MRRFSALAACAAALLVLAFAPQGADELPLGSTAPLTDVAMLDAVSGERLSLADMTGEEGLLVMFSCNTCPYVLAWEDRYDDVYAAAQNAGIGMILINSNEAQFDDVDSYEAMQQHAEEMGYTFPYVVDEGSRLARAFGATRTPHVYLFDEDMELVYRGAIDDNAQDAEAVEETFLMDALQDLAAGEPIGPASTRSVGCTIKFAD